ncbi:uncharacterized protein LOC117322412 isoform X1 [Pecten maximus]|uniref:uncharacterized protein LOC117322412 isoform X1 n=3 Tax=Pecten maximus TaxID=6579 RepID=UPI0014581A17|nr:uncharacterized protein LOC117322412 isoform X1 [Pecten maximus]
MSRARFMVSSFWRKRCFPSDLSYSCLKRLYCVKLTSNQKEIHGGQQIPAPIHDGQQMTIHTPAPIHDGQQMTIHTEKSSPKLMLDAKHEKKVLSFLNGVTEKSVLLMKGMKLDQALVTDIMNFRSRNAKICDVNDLLKADVVSFVHLQSLCTELKKTYVQHNIFCYPELSRKKTKNLQSIVVIDIENLRSVSWIKVNRQLEVKDWGHATLVPDPDQRRFDHAFLYDVAKAALPEIPRGCSYIIKETGSETLKRNKLSSQAIHIRILRSIFTTLLKLKVYEVDESSVHTVNMHVMPEIYSSVGKWFHYVSNCEILKQGLDGKLEKTFVLQIPTKLLVQYNNICDDLLQEQYASVALLANSFYKLVLCD